MSGIFDQVINYAPPSLLKGTVTYKGTWSAATNTPTLINPPDSTTNGFYYVVSAAGTQFSLVFNIGDWIISNGSAWEKVDNTDAVSSVFGRTGAVVGVSTDYSSVGITATAVGASSPSTGAFTTLSATTPLAATSGGTGLSSLGTGVATFLGTPTSANLAAAVTNETGSGSLVFGTSPTITTPVIAQINDASGNETLKLASIASAVNEVTIENAATGNAVHISATGGDASVGLHLVGKGASGYVNVQDSTDATKRIMFNASGGTTATRTMLSSTQTVDRILSLPDATDTLVGKATTDTLTNKTLTSPTITGGALNGTLGATTPSTVAATTVGATGIISSTSNNPSAEFGKGNGTAASVRLNPHTATYHNWSIDNGVTSSGTLNIAPSTAVGGNTYTTPVAYFTTTGLNSTAIGATTPSTGAFTTVAVSGSTATALGVTISPGGWTNKHRFHVPYSGDTPVLSNNLNPTSLTSGTLDDTAASGTALTLGPSGSWSFGVATAGVGARTITNYATISTTGAAITGALSATGLISGAVGAYFPSITAAPSGSNLEIGYDSGNNIGVLQAYNRTGSAWRAIGMYGLTSNHYASGSLIGSFSSTGLAVTGTGTFSSTIGLGSGTPSANIAIKWIGSTGYVFSDTIVNGKHWQIGPNVGSSGNDDTWGFYSYTAANEILQLTTGGAVVKGTLSATGGISSSTGNLSLTAASRGVLCGYTGATGSAFTNTDDTSNSQFVVFTKSNGGTIGSVSRVTTTDAVVYNTTSDARLKENLRDFTDSGRLIDSLKPRVFDWKDSDSNGKDVIGFVAQEEHAADPIFAHIGAVSVGDDDPTTIAKQWQRSDAALIPILVAELQSLRKRLAALEAK